MDLGEHTKTTPFPCAHAICHSCARELVRRSMNACPICRVSQSGEVSQCPNPEVAQDVASDFNYARRLREDEVASFLARNDRYNAPRGFEAAVSRWAAFLHPRGSFSSRRLTTHRSADRGEGRTQTIFFPFQGETAGAATLHGSNAPSILGAVIITNADAVRAGGDQDGGVDGSSGMDTGQQQQLGSRPLPVDPASLPPPLEADAMFQVAASGLRNVDSVSISEFHSSIAALSRTV
tara:strand:- start:2387 stop:3094 length:708 start_codon:yes stop_codon:yes gene_type:complete